MKRRTHSNPLMTFVALLLVSAVIGACGSASKESGGTSGTVPTSQAPTVGVDVCLNCHAGPSTAWFTGTHANVNLTPSYSDDAACMSCHDLLGDGRRTVYNAPAVGCESCHGGGGQHYGIGPIAMTRVAADANGSGQFNTCTSCHQMGTVSTTHSGLAGHAAVPGDTRLNSGTSQTFVYFVNKMDEQSCSGCHNPHSANLTVNDQYARSGHGNALADPWIHYDWKGSDRRSCQRCHTSTGFKNYANSPATYSAANNNFSHLLLGSATTDTTDLGQLETLYCWGCHTNYSGSMRNPGRIVADYGVVLSYPSNTYPSQVYATVTYTYPDVSKSNVCMACHTGRESGESIKALNTQATPTVDFNNLSFINSHYLTAGGTIFGATGYEFTGLSYANLPFYEHDKIGTAAAVNTGVSGPCVGCHMSYSTEKHIFLPVSAPNGTITAITSSVCAECHKDYSPSPPGDVTLSPVKLEGFKDEVHSALKALQARLDARGIYFHNAHPYFYRLRTNTGTASVTNGSALVTLTSVGTTTKGDLFRVDADGTFYTISSVNGGANQLTLSAAYAGTTAAGAAFTVIRGGSGGAVKDWTGADNDGTGATTGKNNMGAAFNFNLIEHDPGAFAHNNHYIKLLIYDSIDWLNDNTMNQNVDLTGYPEAITWYGSVTPARP